MKGARPITKKELNEMTSCLFGKYTARNKAMLTLQFNTGLRVSELTGLNVGDVWQAGQVVDFLTVRKAITKGHKERLVPLNEQAKASIREIMTWKAENNERVDPERPLFLSRNRRRITSRQVSSIIQGLGIDAGMSGNVSTHSLRKGFATAVFSGTKNILAVKELLGHESVNTTQKYIGIGMDQLQSAVTFV